MAAVRRACSWLRRSHTSRPRSRRRRRSSSRCCWRRSCRAAMRSSFSARSSWSPPAWLIAAIITAGRRQGRVRTRRLLRRLHAEGAAHHPQPAALAHFALAGFAALLIAAGAFARPQACAPRLGAAPLGWRDPAGDRGGRAAVSPLPRARRRAAHAAGRRRVGSDPRPGSGTAAGGRRRTSAPQIAGVVIAAVMAAVAGLDWLPLLTFTPARPTPSASTTVAPCRRCSRSIRPDAVGRRLRHRVAGDATPWWAGSTRTG